MLEGEGADGAVGLGVKNHHHGKRQLSQAQPVGERQYRQMRQFQTQVDDADQRHAMGLQIQPLAGGNPEDHHQQPARQAPDSRA